MPSSDDCQWPEVTRVAWIEPGEKGCPQTKQVSQGWIVPSAARKVHGSRGVAFFVRFLVNCSTHTPAYI